MTNEELIERFETYIIGMRFGLHIEYDSQMYSKTKAELLRRLAEIDRLTERAEKAEVEVKFNKGKLRYAADLLLKDKQEYITLAKDLYWDSMEHNKDIILKHIEAIWELWERQED